MKDKNGNELPAELTSILDSDFMFLDPTQQSQISQRHDSNSTIDEEFHHFLDGVGNLCNAS